MTAEEYIVEEYQAARLENLMLKTNLEAANKTCDELMDIIFFILKHAKEPEIAGAGRLVNIGYIWEVDDKEMFDKIVKIFDKLKDESNNCLASSESML